MRHNICGNNFPIKPSKFTSTKRRCPHCSSSNAVQRITTFLNKKEVRFKKEYTFNDLRSRKRKLLRFDFAILSDSGELKYLLEYDGQYHFKKVHERHDFESQTYNDKLKDNYCMERDIRLHRIAYHDEKDIETILENIIKDSD